MRGTYRAAFESLADDVDFQNLTPLAQAVFWTLKLKLGQYGIGTFYVSTLAEIHRKAKPKQITAALEELEQPKPSRDRGWIRREQNIIWIVNAFRHEPSLDLANRNHRIGAFRFAKTLPSSVVVSEFIDYYSLTPDGNAMGIPSPTPSASHENGRSITEKKTVGEETDRPSSPSSPPAAEPVATTEDAIAAVLPGDTDRIALTSVLLAVSSKIMWLAEIAASLNDMPGHVHVSPTQLGSALRDFAGSDAIERPSLNHFRGFLKRAKEPPHAGNGRSRKPNGNAPRNPQHFTYNPTNSEDDATWRK